MARLTPHEVSKVAQYFEYQSPTPEQVGRIQDIRQACKDLAEHLGRTPMDPRCRATAITKLQEVSMWANCGIVFDGK